MLYSNKLKKRRDRMNATGLSRAIRQLKADDSATPPPFILEAVRDWDDNLTDEELELSKKKVC